jgi:DNA replication protein DnaC
MNNPDFSRSHVLNNIPTKKLQEVLASIEKSQEALSDKSIKQIAINRYAESNIPIEYWALKMDRDFNGDPRLLDKYNDYIGDIKKSYIDGKSVILAGSHGVGKTMTIACILKKAVQKGFSACYMTLSDVVSALTQAPNEEKFLARRELVLADFLAIDEVDNRFMQTDHAADLYARNLEGIFRTRAQNKLPTLLATNSPNPVEAFRGPLKESMDSLMKGYLEFFVVMGKDHRKRD